jgi:hypothetical protein
MKFKLNRANKRFLALVALLPISVLILATLYMLGMTHLEGEPRTFMQGATVGIRDHHQHGLRC